MVEEHGGSRMPGPNSCWSRKGEPVRSRRRRGTHGLVAGAPAVGPDLDDWSESLANPAMVVKVVAGTNKFSLARKPEG